MNRVCTMGYAGYLASGMSYDELLADFPELTKDDILACFGWVVAQKEEKNDS